MADKSRGEPVTALAERHAAAVPAELRLTVVSGPDRGREARLRRGRYVVGKDAAADLVLSDPLVSRRHLELVVQDDGIAARDLGSSNGSRFEGARFDTIRIGVGASVSVGDTQLKLALPEDAALGETTEFGELRGRSPAMRRLFADLAQVAASDSAVLIEGETGTGKELIAEGLHRHSSRRKGPFVICDLASVAGTLLESELFGHVRGAFTGADRGREGAFAGAHGGTIFLDEIGELGVDLQPRLLRALERRQVKPVGASEYRDVDVRVVSASNRDLAAEVNGGRFRRDLFYRLAVVHLRVPPLRERPEDVALLARHFLERLASGAGRPAPRLPDETIAALAAHDWPGNARELRNVLERAVTIAPDADALTPEGLGLGDGASRPAATTELPFKQAKEHLVGAWEREYLAGLLARAGHNVSEAARRAGLARPYLHELLKKHGLG